MSRETVAVLGASTKAERYSNRAVKMLKEHGHDVIPVAPAGGEVEGLEAVTGLADIPVKVDTLTVYIGPERQGAVLDSIIELNPSRVILNPGTESDATKGALQSAGIPFQEACTLILLSTGQF